MGWLYDQDSAILMNNNNVHNGSGILNSSAAEFQPKNLKQSTNKQQVDKDFNNFMR